MLRQSGKIARPPLSGGSCNRPSRRTGQPARVQAAIVDLLTAKTIRAAKRLRVNCVTASGGVTCNRVLRNQLADACLRERINLRLADNNLCTDNAAMIGILAEQKLAAGVGKDICDKEILPNWELA